MNDYLKMAILENSDSSNTPIDAHTAATHATVATMLAATGNQYLNPDYLSPMPSDVSQSSNFTHGSEPRRTSTLHTKLSFLNMRQYLQNDTNCNYFAIQMVKVRRK